MLLQVSEAVAFITQMSIFVLRIPLPFYFKIGKNFGRMIFEYVLLARQYFYFNMTIFLMSSLHIVSIHTMWGVYLLKTQLQ